MTRAIAVLRPEPGNAATAAAIEALGRPVLRLPLFEARPIDWAAPDPEDFDALILTSANALRHGGAGLSRLLRLKVHAVGEATAAAARQAGFDVASVGKAGAGALVADAARMGVQRALHLAGRERTLATGGIVKQTISVYASEPRAIAEAAAKRLAATIAMVQSARAAARLAEVVDSARIARGSIALVAIARAAADAAGPGWQSVAVASAPSTEALIEAALGLAD